MNALRWHQTSSNVVIGGWAWGGSAIRSPRCAATTSRPRCSRCSHSPCWWSRAWALAGRVAGIDSSASAAWPSPSRRGSCAVCCSPVSPGRSPFPVHMRTSAASTDSACPTGRRSPLHRTPRRRPIGRRAARRHAVGDRAKPARSGRRRGDDRTGVRPVVRANRDVIGPDPDLIRPGQRLAPPSKDRS